MERERLFSRGALGWLLILSSAVGCEPAGLNADDSTASSELAGPPEGWTRVEPSIAADVQAGRPREVIVMLADEPVRLRRAAFRMTIPSDSFDAYLGSVKADLDSVKDGVLTAASGRLITLHSYDQLPVMHVRVDSPEALAALESNTDVVAVVEDRAMQAFGNVPADLVQVGQPAAAAAGKLGAGTTVAVLDTGTDYKRAPFKCTAPGVPAACPVIFAKDFAVDDKALDTGSFHGTNVSGIVLSMAPAAKIAALDVFDGDWAYTSSILAAINWCVQNKAKYHIVSINMSLGGGAFLRTVRLRSVRPVHRGGACRRDLVRRRLGKLGLVHGHRQPGLCASRGLGGRGLLRERRRSEHLGVQRRHERSRPGRVLFQLGLVPDRSCSGRGHHRCRHHHVRDLASHTARGWRHRRAGVGATQRRTGCAGGPPHDLEHPDPG